MTDKLIPLEHPGLFLKEEFLEPMQISAYRLAKETGVSSMAISEIIRGKRGISPKVGLRIAKFFGVSDGYFLKLQMQYDIDCIKEKEKKELDRIHIYAS